MVDLMTYWEALEPLQKVYYSLAGISTVLYVANFAASMMGHDSDADLDGGASMDMANADGLSSIFSFKAITAFVLGASWSGLSALNNGMGILTVVLFSLLGGALAMGLSVWLVRKLLGLQQDSTLTMDKTVGCTGEVYLTVPANLAKGGQVEILVNNSYKIFEAVSNDPEPLKPHDRIVVLEVLDDNVLMVGRMAVPIDEIETPSLEN